MYTVFLFVQSHQETYCRLLQALVKLLSCKLMESVPEELRAPINKCVRLLYGICELLVQYQYMCEDHEAMLYKTTVTNENWLHVTCVVHTPSVLGYNYKKLKKMLTFFS